MMSWKGLLWTFGVVCLACSCEKTIHFEQTGDYPDIFPDYKEITIPSQMAGGNAALFTIAMKDGRCCLTERERKGDTIWVTVKAWEQGSRHGVSYRPFPIYVSRDSIDPYVAYRLIEPGYESWNRLTICQRQLDSYEEKVIVSNDDKHTQCINCHHFSNGDPHKMLYHRRGPDGGTFVRQDDVWRRLDLKAMGPCKQGTYPAWHPSGRYVAFSSNDTHQCFMREGTQPIEVYDVSSDLILLDLQSDSVTAFPSLNTPLAWETFPAWSSDGLTLYYCAADSVDNPPMNLRKVHYRLMSICFDMANGCFVGEPTVVIDAGDSLSVSHPRPCGEWLMFTRSDYGTFPVWHREADLWMLHIPSGEVHPCEELNSSEAESYHGWSSNGKWVVYGSRRIDGRYTRLYISHFDGQGHFSKPFLLPQKSPEDNLLRLHSYNIPEFVKGPVE